MLKTIKLTVRFILFPIHVALFLCGGVAYAFRALSAWAWRLPPTPEEYRAKMEAFKKSHEAANSPILNPDAVRRNPGDGQ